jgi:acyl-CoA thioester hydrolase
MTSTVDFGHAETISVHFDDIDAMGFVHNARYAVLLERAMTAFWSRHGHSFAGGRPTTTDAFNAVREFSIGYHAPIRGTGDISVHFWVERLGETSAVYGFRMVSVDGMTMYADGRRVIIKLDPTTQRPAPWSAEGRAVAESLLRPVAAVTAVA